jgi:diacylglycerol kinase (ATP)
MEERCRQHFSGACRQREANLNRDWLAIINPRSGGNRNSKRLAELIEALRRLATTTVLTRHPGHASELARDAQSFDGVVAVGGDGLLFEILKGLDCARQRIALVPAGRGNSLARDLGLINRHRMLDVVHWNHAHAVDLMQVHAINTDGVESTYLSASTVALGYPASVTVRARELAVFGKMSYAAAAVATRPTCFNACVQYENEAPRDVRLSGFIANNTRHLANFVGFLKSSFCDGQFEVMEMNGGVLKQNAHNLSALSGTGFYEPHPVRHTTTARLQLEAPQILMMDGEVIPNIVSIRVDILPSALACNGPELS